MPTADTLHGAAFWAILWVSGIMPALLMLYIPIGIAWIIGYGLYLGVRRLGASFAAPVRQGK